MKQQHCTQKRCCCWNMDTTRGYPGPPGAAASSPMRSLSSFKSEIGLQMDDPMSESGPKSFHQYLDIIINGIPLQSLVLLLVCLDCLLVAAELLFSYHMLLDVSPDDGMLHALSVTSLAILSFFLLEVVTRIFTYGTAFRKHKLEIFDSFVVFITFLLDLIFFVSGLQNIYPGVRAITFLIALRLWRFYGIYQIEVNKVREEVSCELQMEKYARRQADAQSDILRANCDQQLKEIAYLRDFIRQHSLDPSDSLKSELITPGSSPLPTLTDVHYDKTDTLRANARLSQEDTSIDDSTSSPTKEPASSVDNNDITSSNPPSPSSSPSKSQCSSETDKYYDSLASRDHAPRPDIITMVKVHIADQAEYEIATLKDGCYTNKGFDDDAGSVNSLQDSLDRESIVINAVKTDGNGSFTNPAYELDASVTRQDSGVGPETQLYRPMGRKESDIEEDERLLRLELEEIRRLSDEAMKAELAHTDNTTTDENGIPTTSL